MKTTHIIRARQKPQKREDASKDTVLPPLQALRQRKTGHPQGLDYALSLMEEGIKRESQIGEVGTHLHS